jgi:hypothetical protein
MARQALPDNAATLSLGPRQVGKSSFASVITAEWYSAPRMGQRQAPRSIGFGCVAAFQIAYSRGVTQQA